ncbi:extracellular solute-binding protein [Pseudactinotalea sp. Z1739]|uniref:extracellular solute-binding protein n=1 Tax=Pseudactinotalea sp. Z1739 TaxID=3413028 RepID=UPI003C7E2F12
MTLRRRDFITASGLGLTGAVLLTACGNGNGGSAGGANGGNGNGGGGGGSEQLSILTPEFAGTSGEAAFEGDILAAFGDHTFSVDYTDWGRLNESLSAAVAGGVVADLIMVGAGWVEPFAERGVLGELPESLLDGKGLDENLVGIGRHDGTLFGIPYFVDGRVLTYHRDMFDAAGIDEDNLPSSLEDFREMLKEVVPDGGVAIDLFSQNLRQVWAHLIGAYGGDMFNEDGTQVAFTDGTGVAALQYMLDLVEDGTASFDVQAAEGQPRPWQQERAAIDMMNSSSWPTLVQETPGLVTEESMGMMLLPSSGGGDPVMFQGGTLLTISARTQNEELVQELVNHMMEPEHLLTAVEEVGKVPSREDLDESVLAENRLLTYTTDNFQYATAFEGGSPAWMEVRGAVAGEIEAAIVGQKTAAEAVDALAAVAEDAISRI